MKLSNRVYRFQAGGPMPAEDPAMAGGAPEEAMGPAPEEAGMAPEQGGQDAMMQQLGQMADEVINQLGPEAAMMLAQAIMEKVQGGMEGGGAPEEAPMPAPEEQPVYQKRGGRVRRIG